MILGFKQFFPSGEPTWFKNKIWASIDKTNLLNIAPKLHSIREGERWREGMKIHMAYGVRTKNYDQFNKGIAELQVCKGVQKIIISPNANLIMIDGDGLNLYTKQILAVNDGFNNYKDFQYWFKDGLHGQIIHWTDYRY